MSTIGFYQPDVSPRISLHSKILKDGPSNETTTNLLKKHKGTKISHLELSSNKTEDGTKGHKRGGDDYDLTAS